MYYERLISVILVTSLLYSNKGDNSRSTFYLFAEDRDNWNRGWQKVIAIDFSWWQPIEDREVWTSYIRTIGRLDMACLWNSLTQSNVFRLLSMSFHTYPQVSASVNAHKTQSTLMTANPFWKYVTQITGYHFVGYFTDFTATNSYQLVSPTVN